MDRLLRYDAADEGFPEPIVLRIIEDLDTIQSVAELASKAKVNAAHFKCKERTFQIALLLSQSWVSPLPKSGFVDEGFMVELSRKRGMLLFKLATALSIAGGKADAEGASGKLEGTEADSFIAEVRSHILNMDELEAPDGDVDFLFGWSQGTQEPSAPALQSAGGIPGS